MDKKEERRIVFRAWDTRNKVMYDNPFNGKIGGINDIFANTGDWIYMQYTGQKDKDNTKVFEEDILEVNTVIGKAFSSDPSRFTNRYIVTFEAGKFTFGGYTFDNTFVENTRVIGNIYGNPEIVIEMRVGRNKGVKEGLSLHK